MNNIFLDGVRIAAVVPTGQARYFHTDQVDSVHIITNDAGGAVNRTEYLPFGETWFQEGETAYAPKYNSQEFDRESGLYFMNARHQDPELGRFESADSVIDGEYSTQGWNRYSYVQNNPIRYKDPTGHLCMLGVARCDSQPFNTSGGNATGSAKPTIPIPSKPQARFGGFQGVGLGSNAAIEKSAVESNLQRAKNKDYSSYIRPFGIAIPIPGSATVNELRESFSATREDISKKWSNARRGMQQISEAVSAPMEAINNFGTALKPLYEQGKAGYEAVMTVKDTLEKVTRVNAASHIAPVSGAPIGDDLRSTIQDVTHKILPSATPETMNALPTSRKPEFQDEEDE